MVTVKDILYVRFAAPDLDLGQRFLEDFGFVLAASTDGARYFRCAGDNHHTYILEQGDPAYLGVGFEALAADDLDQLSRVAGASAIEPTGEPGGGDRVILRDPDGLRIDVVHGMAKVAPMAMRPPVVTNSAYEKHRVNTLVRPALGPAQMKRLGHIALEVTDMPATIAWFGEVLDMRASDIVRAGPHQVMAFVRCAPPGLISDHHAFALFQSGQADFNHAAFEVQDFDAVTLGHYHMKKGEWDHAWGIGRHELGSQIFDYWLDPWGRMIEHFADSDVFDESVPTNFHSVETTSTEIWGPRLPRVAAPKHAPMPGGG